MEKTGLNELRESFLSFFESKGHLRIKSFSLVPQNDPSLLLISSGMAPMKPYFAGALKPPAPRVTDCQKCIRTPDIENVGKTSRHGTYFEMLGNFSFGDYFKEEACAWAWEYVTKVLKMPVELLYVSVYLDDDEAYDIWTQQVGVAPQHMVRLGKKDNFWEIGEGPCGPCSEIYFDRGEKYGCDSPDCVPGCDCDRYVEFWNLVFTQFNSDGKGNYTPLEKKNIDTGLGLDRLACIMQGVDSMFDVDTAVRITERATKITGVAYGASAATDLSLRIITDHARSVTMMICDGIMPTNAGRGYVLRRLLRRAARHGRLLGLKRAFLYEVCETVIEENKGAYPELLEKADFIKTVVKTEEERFGETVENGLLRLEEMIRALKKAGNQKLFGEDAFKLYDTYGFPIDLTIEILQEQGLLVDRETFDAQMLEQRVRAKKARGDTSALGWAGDSLPLDGVAPTEFCGYDTLTCRATVLAVINQGQLTNSAGQGDTVALVFDKTSLYAESGGQCSDWGRACSDKVRFDISDVKKTPDGKILHYGEVTQGSVAVGDSLEVSVDVDERRAVKRAHTATHLLHKALRIVLGSHVEQAGSLVEPDTLRFDFSHFSAVTPQEIEQVEDLVNGVILDGLPVTATEMPIDEARQLGAMALFGEKYGDRVRVVRMGDYSIELCGGTHLDNTAQAGSFKIASEGSIASGVRRIEAVCGMQATRRARDTEKLVQVAAATLKASPGELVARVTQAAGEIRSLLRSNETLNARLAAFRSTELIKFAKTVGDISVLAVKVDGVDGDTLRGMTDNIRDKAPNLICVLASVTEDGKILFAAACGAEALKKGAHAGNILKQIAKMTDGGGGGRPDSATAGGRDASKLDAALEAVQGIAEAMVKGR